MLRGSSYLGSTPKRALNRPRRLGALAAVFLIFSIIAAGFASLPSLSSLVRSASSPQVDAAVFTEASALWCADPKEGNLGTGMNNRRDWKSGSAWYPHSNTSGRVLTAQEAFSNGTRFVNFNGVGESPAMPWFWISPPTGLIEKGKDDDTGKGVVDRTGNTPKGEGADGWYKNMNSSRTPSNCVLGAVGTGVANGILGITSGVTNLIGGISSFAFDPNFVCKPNSGEKNCIDLVGIIGGSGKSSSDGLIGKLTTSVYFPLLAVAALLVGVWIVWNGLAKRQFRETFVGVIWSVGATIFGIALLLNPMILAKAPMVAGNTIASCVIGTFTGSGGCSSTASGSVDNGITSYCKASSSRRGPVDSAALTMTSMSCELWKAFVLQPYAQGSFGAPLDELDVSKSNTTAGKLLAKNPGLSSNDFCVNTKVKGRLDSNFSKTLPLTSGGNKICNLAVYQAYLGVNAKMDSGAGGSPAKVGTIDSRWLKLAQVAASDEGMYNSWAPKDLHLAQIGYALIGLISAVLAAVVVLVVAAFALAYFVTSILIMAFAPFFLLAGVHPGKGRKIMFGWLGQVLSNIMKYAASAIFLVITVALYGAVLSNVSNPGAILIFMIILTVALLMYRRELVDMLGIIDLGGEKLSNKFAEKVKQRVNNTGKTAMAMSGGAVAGVLSNGVRNPFSAEMRGEGNFMQQLGNVTRNNIRHTAGDLTNVARATTDAGRRSVKSRPGFMGEVIKASDRISADNRQDMMTQSRVATDKANAAARERTSKEEEFENLNEAYSSSRATTEKELEELSVQDAEAREAQFGVQSRYEELENAESVALSAVDSSDFRAYQELLNELKNLEIKATIAEEAGDLEAAQGYRTQMQSMTTEAEALRSRMTDEEFGESNEVYQTVLADNVDNSNVTGGNAEVYAEHVRSRYEAVMGTLSSTSRKAEELKSKQQATEAELSEQLITARENMEQAVYAEDNAQRAADYARNEVVDLKPGQVVRNSRLRKQARNIEAMQNEHLRPRDVEESLPGMEEELPEAGVQDTPEMSRLRDNLAADELKFERVSTARRDFDSARAKVEDEWKHENPATSTEVTRDAYARFSEANRQKLEADSTIASLHAQEEQNGGTLDANQAAELAAAKEAATVANRAQVQAATTLKNNNASMQELREQMNQEVAQEFTATPTGREVKLGDVASFDATLNKAEVEAQSSISDKREQLDRLRVQAQSQQDAQSAPRGLPRFDTPTAAPQSTAGAMTAEQQPVVRPQTPAPATQQPQESTTRETVSRENEGFRSEARSTENTQSASVPQSTPPQPTQVRKEQAPTVKSRPRQEVAPARGVAATQDSEELSQLQAKIAEGRKSLLDAQEAGERAVAEKQDRVNSLEQETRRGSAQSAEYRNALNELRETERARAEQERATEDRLRELQAESDRLAERVKNVESTTSTPATSQREPVTPRREAQASRRESQPDVRQAESARPAPQSPRRDQSAPQAPAPEQPQPQSRREARAADKENRKGDKKNRGLPMDSFSQPQDTSANQAQENQENETVERKFPNYRATDNVEGRDNGNPFRGGTYFRERRKDK